MHRVSAKVIPLVVGCFGVVSSRTKGYPNCLGIPDIFAGMPSLEITTVFSADGHFVRQLFRCAGQNFWIMSARSKILPDKTTKPIFDSFSRTNVRCQVSSEIYDLCKISDQACRVTYFARVGVKYMTAC